MQTSQYKAFDTKHVGVLDPLLALVQFAAHKRVPNMDSVR